MQIRTLTQYHVLKVDIYNALCNVPGRANRFVFELARLWFAHDGVETHIYLVSSPPTGVKLIDANKLGC